MKFCHDFLVNKWVIANWQLYLWQCQWFFQSSAIDWQAVEGFSWNLYLAMVWWCMWRFMRMSLGVKKLLPSDCLKNAQWLSGWVLDSRPGPQVQASPASLRCGPWARHIYHSLVLVQPWKTRPCLTETLLMGRKESNQTNKNLLPKYQ